MFTCSGRCMLVHATSCVFQTYLESQVDDTASGKSLRGGKLANHSTRSYEGEACIFYGMIYLIK